MSSEAEARAFVETLNRRITTYEAFEKTLNNVQEAFKWAQDGFDRLAKAFEPLNTVFSQLLSSAPETKDLCPTFIKTVEIQQKQATRMVDSEASSFCGKWRTRPSDFGRHVQIRGSVNRTSRKEPKTWQKRNCITWRKFAKWRPKCARIRVSR